jgi:hypothetical protein
VGRSSIGQVSNGANHSRFEKSSCTTLRGPAAKGTWPQELARYPQIDARGVGYVSMVTVSVTQRPVLMSSTESVALSPFVTGDGRVTVHE